MCRSRRELSNAYFLAKFCFDTAENGPVKFADWSFAAAAKRTGGARRGHVECGRAGVRIHRSGARRSSCGRAMGTNRARNPPSVVELAVITAHQVKVMNILGFADNFLNQILSEFSKTSRKEVRALGSSS